MQNLFILALVLLLSLSTAYSKQYTPKRTYKDAPFLRLGDGYLTYDHLSVGESALKMSDTEVHYSDLQNSVYLCQTIDKTELTNLLNIDFSASGGYSKFSANAMVSYLRHISDTQYTENFTFFERFYTNALLDISQLPGDVKAFSPQAESLYVTNGITAFTNRYGNSFISQLQMGAILIANLKFNFASAMDKQKFDASLGGSFGSLFNANATIKHAAEKSKAKGTIEVSAYQLGGNPLALVDIFTRRDSGYYITSCSLENYKDCQAAIDGIINYAQNNFNKQIKVVEAGKKPVGNLASIGEPFTSTYASKFNLKQAQQINAEVLQARTMLAKNYQTLENNKIFIDHFINSPASSYFKPETDKMLRDLQADLDWNLSLYKQFDVLRCYLPGEESECSEISKTIASYSRPVDQAIIDYYINNGYYEYKNKCTFIPVGHPQDEFPTFANYCFDRWLKGVFIFKLTPDKKNMYLKGNYLSAQHEHHVNLEAMLTTQDANQSYSGIGNFHDLSTGGKKKSELLVRSVKNKA